MIICTKAVSELCRRALGKDKIFVSDIESVTKQLVLDASIAQPPKQAFIVSEVDMVKPKLRAAFFEAAVVKHPTVKIILVARPKTQITAGNGIDMVLVNPKPEAIGEAVAQLVQDIAQKAQVKSSMDYVEPTESYIPKEFRQPEASEQTELPTFPEVEVAETKQPEVPTVDMTGIFDNDVEEDVMPSKPVTNEQMSEAIVDRIKKCNTIADVAIVGHEVSAAKVVKDLLNENNEYAAIEEKLKALGEKIYAVMIDPTIPKLADKWDKVRALTYDQAYFAAKGTSVFERRVEEIIKTLGEKTQELLKQREAEVDKAILFYKRVDTGASAISYPRLSELMTTRSNLLLELAALQKELTTVGAVVDKLGADASREIISSNTKATGIPVVDNSLKARGEALTTEEGKAVIDRILEVNTKSSEKFLEMQDTVNLLEAKVKQLLGVDEEIVQLQMDVIKYLSSKKMSDTIQATSLIKNAMRIYVGAEGVGRTVVPYVLAKRHSRTSANVLFVDLTGTCKLADYGVTPMQLEDWLEEQPEKDFVAVAGNIDVTAENVDAIVQRVANALVRAADYYRVINVVIRPDQQLVFDVLAPDALYVNYLTDMNNRNIEVVKKLLDTMTYDNIVQCVIVNKCSTYEGPIISKLDLGERINVEYKRIPYIQQITECALDGVDPSCVDVVAELCVEAMKDA